MKALIREALVIRLGSKLLFPILGKGTGVVPLLLLAQKVIFGGSIILGGCYP